MKNIIEANLSHLRIGLDKPAQDFRVRHQALGQRGIHDLSHEVRIAHHVGLDLLLHLHEVGRAHSETPEAREATEVSEAEWGLASVS